MLEHQRVSIPKDHLQGGNTSIKYV